MDTECRRNIETEHNVEKLCKRKSIHASTKCSMVRHGCSTMMGSIGVDKVKKLVPVLEWLPEYKWKDYMYGDVVAGITVVSMLIPQSVAFAALAGVPTNYGMYTAFVSAFVCFIFSGSRHSNVGPISIVALMVAESTLKITRGEANAAEYSSTVICLSFVCGIFLILIALFRLGNVISTMLSDPVMSAVTCGGAILVVTNQAGIFLGISVPRYHTLFQAFKYWGYILTHLNEVHWQTLVIGICTMVFIVLLNTTNRKFKPRFPIPVELLAVIVFTACSALIDADGMGVKVVGEISSSLPKPIFPSFEGNATFGNVAVQSIGIAIVICVMGLSLAKTFCKTFNYDISPNQEVFAYGMCNLIGSFFMCFPASASLSRSSLLATVGAHSPIYNLGSGSIMIFVVTILSFLMRALPYTCLSSIIIVALKGLLKKLSRPKELWDIHRGDSLL